MDDEGRQYDDGAITIDGDRIISVGKTTDLLSESGPETERIDLRGHWILPGLINTHVHTSQQLGRGLADDVDLLTWLRERIWPYESHLTEEDSYTSTLLFGLEQIRSGVTCFSEAGGQHVNGMGRAVSELGLRATLARSTVDIGDGLPPAWQQSTDEALAKQRDLFERWHGQANGRIRLWFCLRTIFNNSDELIIRTKELADQVETGIQMHVAEIPEENDFAINARGASTVRHLNQLGALGSNFLAAHTVWLDDDEVEMFAQNDVKVSHCPAAAMRVLGFARIPEMLDAGICVTIGTDSPPCNNRSTLVDEMWLATLIHKGRLLDPTVMPVQTILTMVTRNAARALLWDDAIGSLEAGKQADLMIVDPNTPNMLPLHDPVANLVNAMQANNVESVMVDGRWLMRDRQILCVDEAAILAEAKDRAASVARRAGVQLPDRFNRIL